MDLVYPAKKEYKTVIILLIVTVLYNINPYF